jgi:hypothetical protein
VDSNVLVALISGLFSVSSALGSIFLKDYVDRRRVQTLEVPHQKAEPRSHAEVARTPSALPASRTAGRSWGRPAAIVVGSFVLGMATRALRPLFTAGIHWESLGALVLLVSTAVVLSVSHRKRGFQFAYQFEILALWTGWASGWSLLHGRLWSDLFAVTVAWWLVCAVVGGLIVSVRNPSRRARPNL